MQGKGRTLLVVVLIVTLIVEAPKIAPFVQKIKANFAVTREDEPSTEGEPRNYVTAQEVLAAATEEAVTRSNLTATSTPIPPPAPAATPTPVPPSPADPYQNWEVLAAGIVEPCSNGSGGKEGAYPAWRLETPSGSPLNRVQLQGTFPCMGKAEAIINTPAGESNASGWILINGEKLYFVPEAEIDVLCGDK